MLNSEITTAWDNCLAAAQKYGDYVSALNSIDADITASSSSGTSATVGNTNYDTTSSNDDNIHAIIKEMYANSQEWNTATTARQQWLSERNLYLGNLLSNYGVNAERKNGVWYIEGSAEKLFDKYKKYIYHTGGIAGDDATLKDNEILAKLEKGESVLTAQMWDNVMSMVERMEEMADAFSSASPSVSKSMLSDNLSLDKVGAVSNVTNNENRPVNVSFGDTIINGASADAVDQHAKLARNMMNQAAKLLGQKW